MKAPAFLQSLQCAWAGIAYCLRREANWRRQLLLGAIVLLLC